MLCKASSRCLSLGVGDAKEGDCITLANFVSVVGYRHRAQSASPLSISCLRADASCRTVRALSFPRGRHRAAAGCLLLSRMLQVTV